MRLRSRAARPGEGRRGWALIAFGLAVSVSLVVSGALGTTGCDGGTAPTTGSVVGDRLSRDGLYRIGISPESGTARVGPVHAWIVRVVSAGGAPVPLVRLAFDGGMPQHGHGLPTRPRVARSLGGGRFRVEGVRFHMSGDWQIRIEVAGPDGGDVATFEVRVDPPALPGRGRWAPEQLALLRSLALPSLDGPPPSPSNRLAEDPRAAALGRALFFDPRLSRDGTIACASCHDPGRYFTDGRPVSRGLGESRRNAPTLVGAAWSPWLYRDGRRDSLWSQALAPIEASEEMGSTRLAAVRLVARDPAYADVFRTLLSEPLPVLERPDLPTHAGPFGDEQARAAWQRLSPADRGAIDRAYATLGKALAAWERGLRPTPSRFDRYVEAMLDDGPEAASGILSQEEEEGLALFLDAERTRCLRCHNGPLLTNHGFHDIGSGRIGNVPDLGRIVGIEALRLDAFNCLGRYSDAEPEDCSALRFLDRRPDPMLSGAFRTPTLRGLTATAPYFHDGSLPDLASVVAYYVDPPVAPPNELVPIDLDADEQGHLVSFLAALSGGYEEDDPGASSRRTRSSEDEM